MDPIELLRQIGVFALMSLVLCALPVVVAAIYAARPTEIRLALMRPLSLAALFASLAGTFSGFTNILQGMAASAPMATVGWFRVYGGTSEALVPLVFGFTCLTVAWMLVTIGMWRGIRE